MEIWKTITIQNKPNLSDLKVSDYAQDMLKKVEFPVKEQTINLVKVTLSDWFGEKYPTTDEIYARAKSEGLDLCPPQVGPQLRVDYMDQPSGEWLYIGMSQISDSGGGPCVFRLGHGDGGLWLDDYWANPVNDWYPRDQFVFSSRKSDTLTLRPSDPLEKIKKENIVCKDYTHDFKHLKRVGRADWRCPKCNDNVMFLLVTAYEAGIDLTE